MTSAINPNSIDITYPIAGQDNDTQGFRTNYVAIQNNFTVASREITALQSNVAVSPKFTSIPYSGTSSGLPGQMSYGTINVNVTITKTANSLPGGNLVTVSSIQNLGVGMSMTISGGNIGGLVTDTTYYITSIIDDNHVTVGTKVNSSKQVALANASAGSTITGTISSTYLYLCTSTDTWVRTPLTTWSAA